MIRFNIILSALGSPRQGSLFKFSYFLIVRPVYQVFCSATHLAVLVSIIDKESDFVNSSRQNPGRCFNFDFTYVRNSILMQTYIELEKNSR